MPTTTYHVVPSGDQWAVKREGAEQNSRVTDSQDDAVDIAESFARNQAPARVVVHNDNGQIATQTAFEPTDSAPSSAGSIVKHPAFALGVGLAAGLVGLTIFATQSDWGRSRERPWR